MTTTLKSHPTNPHGVLVPCATCGTEMHLPRDEFVGTRTVYLTGGGTKTEGPSDPANVTCSYDCMKANS